MTASTIRKSNSTNPQNIYQNTPVQERELLRTFSDPRGLALLGQRGSARRPKIQQLISILSLSPEDSGKKYGKAAQTQAALWVMGYGQQLGNFGSNGFGIDGKFGRNTRKALQQFQKQYQGTCQQDALIRTARHVMMGRIKREGWRQTSQRLRHHQQPAKIIRSFRSTYEDTFTALAEDMNGTKTEIARGRNEFFALTSRMGARVHRINLPKKEAALVRKGWRDLINQGIQIKERLAIYQDIFADIKDATTLPHQEFTKVKREYYQMSSRLGISKKTMIATLRFMNERHQDHLDLP